jgi:hypothetical protein
MSAEFRGTSSLCRVERKAERAFISTISQHLLENLVDVLGSSEHQYIAARHSDKDHEHIHVAIKKIHPESFRIHSPAWDHQKLFTAGRAREAELGPRNPRTRASNSRDP